MTSIPVANRRISAVLILLALAGFGLLLMLDAWIRRCDGCGGNRAAYRRRHPAFGVLNLCRRCKRGYDNDREASRLTAANLRAALDPAQTPSSP